MTGTGDISFKKLFFGDWGGFFLNPLHLELFQTPVACVLYLFPVFHFNHVKEVNHFWYSKGCQPIDNMGTQIPGYFINYFHSQQQSFISLNQTPNVFTQPHDKGPWYYATFLLFPHTLSYKLGILPIILLNFFM
jgi:hypothetical protein